ncbi:hypothetical protein BI291_14790 [Thalassotalea sp. PP2-459]|nr:hypothetical protein BI291_14790 [Thalassotalea sp. PP2-459]
MEDIHYKLKMFGVFMLPCFQGATLLGGFEFPIFKYIAPFYAILLPFVMILSVLFYLLGNYKASIRFNDEKSLLTSDKIINLIGGFYLGINIVMYYL